jgi:4-aminobutyrate aminotransferase/(S)-3-amino-2-methylpropionate transaminase
VIDAAFARGLLLITCGVYGNCIRVLVPLVVGDDELEEALAVWEEALAASLD